MDYWFRGFWLKMDTVRRCSTDKAGATWSVIWLTRLSVANYATQAPTRSYDHQAQIFFDKGSVWAAKPRSLTQAGLERSHWYHAELRKFFNLSIDEIEEMTSPVYRVSDFVSEVSNFAKPRINDLCSDWETRSCRVESLLELA